MAYNGSGDYSLPAGQPVVTGTTISSTTHNNLANDQATAFDTAWCRDGQAAATANIPMGGFRLTGLGNATAVDDAIRVSQVQNNSTVLLSSVAGTNTITGSATPTPAAYASGQKFILVPANTNTGATTLNVSSLGAKNVFWNGAACVGGELRQSIPAVVEYDGTQFHIIGNAFNAPFLDTHEIVEGSADSTKKLRIEVDGLTTATTRVWTAPDADLTVVGTTTTQTLTNKTITDSTNTVAATTLTTEVATTSGTSVELSATVPSWAKKITVQFKGVSTNGTDGFLVQIGDSGGYETTGYTSRASATNGTGSGSTSGFLVLDTVAAADTVYGFVTLTLQDASDFTWLIGGVLLPSGSTDVLRVSAGHKALSAALDRIRITTTGGTNTFDAGSASLLYE